MRPGQILGTLETKRHCLEVIKMDQSPNQEILERIGLVESLMIVRFVEIQKLVMRREKVMEIPKIKTSRNSENTKIIRNGQNLMTTVKPRLTIRMKIVISMHQDSEA